MVVVFSLSWRLAKGAGVGGPDVGGCKRGLQDCGPLPAAGNPYHVEVRDVFSDDEIARASCRERVKVSGGAVSLKKTGDGTVPSAIDNPLQSDRPRFGFEAAKGKDVSSNI